VEGALLGDFEPDRHKTGDDKKSVDSFTVVAPGSTGLEAALIRGRIVRRLDQVVQHPQPLHPVGGRIRWSKDVLQVGVRVAKLATA